MRQAVNRIGRFSTKKATLLFMLLGLCLLLVATASAKLDKETEGAFKGLFPAAHSFAVVQPNRTLPTTVDNPIYRAVDASGKELGVVYVARLKGFKSEIVTAVGLDARRAAVVGVKVVAQGETPSLGGKVAEETYLSQYKDKSLSDAFSVGGDIDGITRATISASALANGVRDSARGVLAALEADR